jgi:hypothetical protein
MLSRLLELIKNNQGIIERDDLCKELEVSPEMLEGLISSLVRMGRLVEITDNKPPNCPTCKDCVIQQQCTLVNLFKERRYEVVDHDARVKNINPLET